MTDPVAPLLDSPALPAHVARLQRVLDDEADRRDTFRDSLEGEKAEFINGEIIMHSPARDAHTATVGRLFRLLSTYAELHSLGVVRFEKALVEMTRNDYEPDICFFGRETAEGIRARTLVYPPPDLAVEVLSTSTERRDRGIKFEDYAAHGVGEYWIVDADTQMVEQYLLDGDTYRLALKSDTGELSSQVVEGFTTPVRAAFDDDANLSALRALLAA
ncbi:MAG: Uma2 family endonuclease [Bacteroidota bacterium]